MDEIVAVSEGAKVKPVQSNREGVNRETLPIIAYVDGTFIQPRPDQSNLPLF